jgi:hypothetical protein
VTRMAHIIDEVGGIDVSSQRKPGILAGIRALKFSPVLGFFGGG